MQGRMEFRTCGHWATAAFGLFLAFDPYSTENLNVHHTANLSGKFAASVPVELAAKYFVTGPNARKSVGHQDARTNSINLESALPAIN